MFHLFRCSLALALMLGVAAPALADPPLEPAACTVPGAKRLTVGKFQITLQQFNTFKQEHRFPVRQAATRAGPGNACKKTTLANLVKTIGSAPGNTQKTSTGGVKIDLQWCGIVDDWQHVALMAYQSCNTPTLGNGKAYFKADPSYTAFNDSANHHSLFKATPNVAATSQNPNIADDTIVLEGSCYVCQSGRSVGTSTSVPRDQVKAQEPAKGD